MTFITFQENRHVFMRKNQWKPFKNLYQKNSPLFQHLSKDEVEGIMETKVNWAFISKKKQEMNRRIHVTTEKVSILAYDKERKQYLVAMKDESLTIEECSNYFSVYIDFVQNRHLNKAGVGYKFYYPLKKSEIASGNHKIMYQKEKGKMVTEAIHHIYKQLSNKKINHFTIYVSNLFLYKFLKINKGLQLEKCGCMGVSLNEERKNEPSRQLARKVLDKRLNGKKKRSIHYFAWVDASVHQEKTKISGILKDKNQSVLATYKKEIEKNMKIEEAELEATIEMIKLLKRNKLKNTVIHTDNKTVYDRLTDPSYQMKRKKFEKYQHAKNIMYSVPNVQIKWVPRKQNKEADKLLKTANGGY